MAQQSSFYNVDGTTRTYPSSKHIASKQHVAVYFQSVTTSTWSVIEQSLYELVNNSIVFTDAPDSALYSQIEIRVADTAAELTESPSDIAIVAGAIADISSVANDLPAIEAVSSNLASIGTVSASITNVNTVAGNITNVNTVAGNVDNVGVVATNITDVASVANTVVPNIVEILAADDNAATATNHAGIATIKASEAATSATNAQLSTWEAEAEKMTADSYATEDEDVFVKIYTSNGDGTFTTTNTTEYSALHWAAKAQEAVTIDPTPTDGSANAVSSNGVFDVLTEKAPKSNPIFSGTVSLGTNATLVFEGSTADEYETTLTVVNPTADRTLSLPNESGTLATQGYVNGQALGVGQTLQQAELTNTGATFTDGTAKFRAKGTAYLNTTGKPIWVTVVVTENTGGTNGIGLLVSPDGIDYVYAGTITASGYRAQLSAIIPNLHYYKIDAGIDTLVQWAELR